jgi:hypothetical protein
VKNWRIAVVVAAVIAVGVGALFGGRAWGASGSSDTTANAQTAQASGDGNRPSGMPGDGSGQFGGPGGGRSGGNMVSGSIIAADDSSITIKTSDGSTKIVLVSGSTSISVTSEGSIADLDTGEDVVISGTTNNDGTTTAESIRVGASLPQGGMAAGGTSPSDGTAPSGSGTSTSTTAE